MPHPDDAPVNDNVDVKLAHDEIEFGVADDVPPVGVPEQKVAVGVHVNTPLGLRTAFPPAVIASVLSAPAAEDNHAVEPIFVRLLKSALDAPRSPT
jgi:hypothetical protein